MVHLEVEVIEVEFENLHKGISAGVSVTNIGFWLDENMPNPPLPDVQRWTIGYSTDGRVGFRFADEKDATHFMLRWS